MTGATFAMGQHHTRVVDEEATHSERTYALFMHLTTLAYHIIPIPVIPVLVMWLIRKSESPFLNDHGKEALNFQVSLVIYFIILMVIALPTLGLSVLLFVPLYALAIVAPILAAVAANRGEFYRYPACLRLVR